MLFTLCFLFSIILTFFFYRYFSKKELFIDIPNHRSSHFIPVPRIGGLSVFLSFFLFNFLFFKLEYFIFYASFLFFLGLYDDYKSISNKIKLFFILLFSFLVLNTYSLNLLEMSLFILLFSSIVIGFNFIDGLDGLSSLLAISTLSFISYIYFQNNDIFLNYSLLLIFSILGFFLFNWNPAKIFFGDGGTMFIGFLLGYFSFDLYFKEYITIFQLILLNGIYLIDVYFVILFRLIKGVNPFHSDRRHLHHILYSSLKNIKLTVFTLVLSHISLIIISFI